MTSVSIYVMDVDDTIILHTKERHNIYNMNNDTELKDLINDLNHVGLYLYTNGTYGHGYKVAENLQLNDIIDGIFARDNIPSMKPLNSSFNCCGLEIS